MKTWSSWRESSNIGSTEAALAELLFQVADVESTVSRAAEGVFREVVGRTPLEAILVSGRSAIRSAGRPACCKTGSCRGPGRAGRPGARGRCPSAARGRAGLPRRLIGGLRRGAKPEPGPRRRRRSGTGQRSPKPRRIRDAAKTRADRLVNRSAGEKEPRFSRGQSAHAGAPALTEFRLLWDTLATVLPGRPKLILDRHAGGHRHVWLADPAQLGPGLGRVLAPATNEARARSQTIEATMPVPPASRSTN